MLSPPDPRQASLGFLTPLLSPLLQKWPLLFSLAYKLYTYLTQARNLGMYQILDYDTTLELVDKRGQTAIVYKRQKVRFLQDNILVFQDYAWGEGEIFADYKCAPGVEVDRYQAGDRWHILISLRESKSKGDIEDFYIERTVKHGFTQAEEWFQVEIRHRTDHLRLAVLFPRKRHCRRALVWQRRTNRTLILGQERFVALPDGRQLVFWEAPMVAPLDVFTLRWQW
jgi:hypothetical protein